MSINSGIKKQKKYIADENGNHTLTSLWTSTDTVEDSVGNTLTELLAQIGDPTVTVVASEESGIAKRYTIYQGGTAVSVPIDIPLDMVIQSGSLVDITFHDDKLWDGVTDVTALIMPAGQTPTSANAGKYIKLVIANSSGDIIYISLLDLTFTDENVKQNYVTDAEIIRPLLLAGSNDAQTKIEDTSKSPTLKYNTKGSHLIVTDLSTPSKYIDIKPDDVTLNGSGNTWDGTNTSLKSAIASAGGTDENVKQSPTTTNSNYEVLLSGTADNTEHTEGTKKSDGLKYNPSKQSLSNGFLNNASGYYSHAEGDQTIASGANSHSEGSGNTASGNTAHAEGSQNYASGTYSHVEGTQNEATHYCQHVLGMFNELDPSSATADSRGTYVEIVGNGTNGSNRSNARTLDWDGNETLAGTLTANDVINTGYWDGINTSLKTAIAYSKTASGSIASFDDGSTLPLKTLQVSIEPVQDLHGYDAPWVAGGGKNILAPTFYDGIGYNVAVGTVLTLTEAADVTALGDTYTRTVENWGGFGMRSPQLATGTYYLMAELASVNMRSSIYVLNSDMSVSRNLGNQGSGTTRSIGMVITLSGDEAYIAFNCLTSSAGNVSISTPMVALSSTATSFAPYENICPISGHTSCNVTDCGVNVWDEDWELGAFDGNGQKVSGQNSIRSKNYIAVTPNTTYYYKNGSNASISPFEYDVNKNFIKRTGYIVNNTFTVSENTHYLMIGLPTTYGNTYKDDISINYPSTDTSYHAYNGNTYNIAFTDGTNPLTVYGGTLDVTSGVLTVTYNGIDLGDLTWTAGTDATGQYFSAPLSPNAKKKTGSSLGNNICDIYPISPSTNVVDKSLAVNNNGNVVYVRDTSYENATAFKTGMSGHQLVYELETPLTYQLTPTAVASILGVNNVSVDTGSVLACEYVPNNLIAKIEKDIIDNSGAQTNINYSTTEQDTGRKWIDGRPVYVRTFNISSLGNGSNTIVDASFKPSVYDNVLCVRQPTWQYHSTQDIINVNNRGASGSNGFIMIAVEENNGMRVSNSGIGFTATNINFTIEYTKIADIVTP